MKILPSLFLALCVFGGYANAAPFLVKVAVKCANPGTHQDVAKTPWVTNTSNSDVPASKKIYWKSNDGDQGSIQGPLKKGQSKSGLGRAGNGYQCQAWYYKTLILIPLRSADGEPDLDEAFED